MSVSLTRSGDSSIQQPLQSWSIDDLPVNDGCLPLSSVFDDSPTFRGFGFKLVNNSVVGRLFNSPENMRIFGCQMVNPDHYGISPTEGGVWLAPGYVHPKVRCQMSEVAGHPTIIVAIDLDRKNSKRVKLLPCWSCRIVQPSSPCSLINVALCVGGQLETGLSFKLPVKDRIKTREPSSGPLTPNTRDNTSALENPQSSNPQGGRSESLPLASSAKRARSETLLNEGTPRSKVVHLGGLRRFPQNKATTIPAISQISCAQASSSFSANRQPDNEGETTEYAQIVRLCAELAPQHKSQLCAHLTASLLESLLDAQAAYSRLDKFQLEKRMTDDMAMRKLEDAFDVERRRWRATKRDLLLEVDSWRKRFLDEENKAVRLDRQYSEERQRRCALVHSLRVILQPPDPDEIDPLLEPCAPAVLEQYVRGATGNRHVHVDDGPLIDALEDLIRISRSRRD